MTKSEHAVPAKVVHHRDTCRLCESSNLELVLPLEASALADAYVPAEKLDQKQEVFPLDLFLCLQCGHLQLLDVVNPEVLFRDYIYVTSSSPGLTEHFRKYCEDILRYAQTPAGSLAVDIGSNEGRLLRFFQEHGMRVLGVDPAEEIAAQATRDGIPTVPAFFNVPVAHKIRSEHGAAKIVTANNVYAHIDDLGGVTDGIRDLLAPDGIFVFEVSYLVDLMQNMVFDFVYHEHLCYHSVKSLAQFFQRHGMELISAERVPTKGGSIRGIAQLAGGPRPVAPSISELISLEDDLGLHGPETFKAFAAKIQGLKHELLDLLADLKRQGKTVAGFGASATATTLIYHFELGDKLDFIVDDYVGRQNLFSPGHHLPVLSPEALFERRPDYVVVLAWRFADAIVERHLQYLELDGHFIIPLPTLRIVSREQPEAESGK